MWHRNLKAMIKNIIFDWGGVLIHLDKRRCTEAFRKLGVEVSDELTNPYGQRADLMDFEKGLMTVDEFHHTVRRIYAPELTDAQIDGAWNALLLDIPTYKLDFLLSLKGRYRLFLLSNTNAVHWEEGRKRFDYKGHRAEDYFERIFLSHEIHRAGKHTGECQFDIVICCYSSPPFVIFVAHYTLSCHHIRPCSFYAIWFVCSMEVHHEPAFRSFFDNTAVPVDHILVLTVHEIYLYTCDSPFLIKSECFLVSIIPVYIAAV